MLIDLQVSDSSAPEKPRRRKIINTRYIAEIDPRWDTLRGPALTLQDN